MISDVHVSNPAVRSKNDSQFLTVMIRFGVTDGHDQINLISCEMSNKIDRGNRKIIRGLFSYLFIWIKNIVCLLVKARYVPSVCYLPSQKLLVNTLRKWYLHCWYNNVFLLPVEPTFEFQLQ